ncbi:hypothetical protein N9A04_00170 [Rickettsiales bacterium]|nr:hypothetical protein [Rickettsiales bacterium]
MIKSLLNTLKSSILCATFSISSVLCSNASYAFQKSNKASHTSQKEKPHKTNSFKNVNLFIHKKKQKGALKVMILNEETKKLLPHSSHSCIYKKIVLPTERYNVLIEVPAKIFEENKRYAILVIQCPKDNQVEFHDIYRSRDMSCIYGTSSASKNPGLKFNRSAFSFNKNTSHNSIHIYVDSKLQ